MSIRKSLSPGHVSALWVPQEAEGSSSLEVLRSHLDKALSNLNYLGVPSTFSLFLGLWLYELGDRSKAVELRAASSL